MGKDDGVWCRVTELKNDLGRRLATSYLKKFF